MMRKLSLLAPLAAAFLLAACGGGTPAPGSGNGVRSNSSANPTDTLMNTIQGTWVGPTEIVQFVPHHSPTIRFGAGQCVLQTDPQNPPPECQVSAQALINPKPTGGNGDAKFELTLENLSASTQNGSPLPPPDKWDFCLPGQGTMTIDATYAPTGSPAGITTMKQNAIIFDTVNNTTSGCGDKPGRLAAPTPGSELVHCPLQDPTATTNDEGAAIASCSGALERSSGG